MYYYVNKNAQETGEHEIHKSTCKRLPNTDNRLSLGFLNSYSDAKAKAKQHYYKVDGCYYCLPEHHKM